MSKTLSKPARSPRQPPHDSAWKRYHPYAEGALSFLSSNAVHALVIGGAVLWSVYLAYYFGFARPPHSLPVEPVQLAGGGANGPGDGPEAGDPGPREDLVGGPKRPGDLTDPSVALLKDPPRKETKIEFPPDDPRPIAAPDMSLFRDLEKNFPGLKKGFTSGDDKDKGGAGQDGGKDKAAGPGSGDNKDRRLNEREKRMLRWALKFNTSNGADYLRQLDALGAILVIPDGPKGSFKVIRELSKRPPPLLDEDPFKIERIWWTDVDPRSVKSLMEAMGLPNRPEQVTAFIPQELEADLAKKELAYKGLTTEQIEVTTFEVVPVEGGKYDVRVKDQKAK